jgi:hypothetical protein
MSSCTSKIYSDEISLLRDLYTLRSYPLQVIAQWTKSFTGDAYKNHLQWDLSSNDDQDDDGIWPLKSTMNPVWQKLKFASFSKVLVDHMLSAGLPEGQVHYWSKHIITSLKHPFNMGDKENKFNRHMCSIMKQDTLLKINGRTLDNTDSDDSLEVLTPGQVITHMTQL